MSELVSFYSCVYNQYWEVLSISGRPLQKPAMIKGQIYSVSSLTYVTKQAKMTQSWESTDVYNL